MNVRFSPLLTIPTQAPFVGQIRRTLRNLFDVYSADPVRRVLNRGFLAILALWLPIAGSVTALSLIAWDPHYLIRNTCVFLGLCLTWWLTRRGGVSGIAIMAGIMVVVFAGTQDVIRITTTSAVLSPLVLLPIVVSALFITPWSGAITYGASVAVLYTAMRLGGQSADVIWDVMFSMIAEIGGITALLTVGAAIFTQTLHAWLALNTTLEQRVADRTADLAEANAFIERRAAERAKQVAAVVHDLRHTAVAADSVLSLLELDIEDAEATISEIATTVGINVDDASGDTPMACLIEAFQTLVGHISTADNDIRSALEGQRGLLSDMLDMAQLEADAIRLHPAAIDFGDIVEKVTRFLTPQAATKCCKITLTTGETLTAWCDVQRLERVLHNVIGNAIKYTSAFRTDGSGQIDVEVMRQAEQVFCRVSDNGPGIAPDDLIRLGQRFQRVERSTAGASGTGLGLHFCKGVLEASNGILRIESAGIGLGSCLTIILPVPTA